MDKVANFDFSANRNDVVADALAPSDGGVIPDTPARCRNLRAWPFVAIWLFW